MKKILIYILFPLLFAACADEQYELTGPEHSLDVPEGKVNIDFDLTSGGFHKPETKAIRSDVDFDTPWVLSFKLQNQGSPNPDTLFAEAVKTKIKGDKYYMHLSESTDPHLLFFVANADKVIENKKSLFSGKTYGEVMSLLTFGNPSPDANYGLISLSNPQGTVPFADQNIPMTASAGIDQIVSGSKLRGTINLQRIVSKIYLDATKANQKDGFFLTGLTVIDVPSIGYMDNTIDIRSVQPQKIIDYGRKTGSDRLTTLVLANIENNTTLSASVDRPVYVYPFLENDSRGGTYQVIFAGHFGDNKTKYFKIKLGGLNNPVALNKPNTSILINIESIQNSGYISLEHALQYEPSTGVVTKVTLLDKTLEFVANGQYYMGLSNSSYDLSASGEYDNIKIATVTTNAFKGGSVAPSSKIELLPGATNMSLVPGQTLNSNSTDILVRFTSHNTASGTVRVTIGDLVKDISVRKYLPFKSNYDKSGVFISDKVIRAKLTGEAAEYVDFAGLAFSDNSSVKLDEVSVGDITNTGENLYLYFRRKPGVQNFKIHISRYDGDSRIFEFRQQTAFFAGSNIYWDHLEQRLKFDDTPLKGIRAPHEAYMGLMFKWGSIVGMAPVSSFECTFNPLNFDYATPRDIPYSSAPLNSGSYEDCDDDNLEAYSNVNYYNLETGDICRFMTARGLTPNNTKWRMPTAKELNDLTEVGFDDSFGDFGDETSQIADVNGQYKPYSGLSFANIYFPMSGIADNYSGRMQYVGSTSYLNSATSGTMSESNVGIVMNQHTVAIMTSAGRGWFKSVRCVRDNSPEAIVPLYKIEYDLNGTDGGSVTIPAGSKLLNKFVNKGGSATLPNVELQSSTGKIHAGWSVNGTFYAFGANISVITQDITVKPVFIDGISIGDQRWAISNVWGQNQLREN